MINPAWLTILEVVAHIAQQPYANPVGKTIFQKIPYILTEQGVETGFKFTPVDYGLSSMDMMNAFQLFTRANLTQEHLQGRTTIIQIDADYAEYKTKHQAVLDKYAKPIERTVDLFSRIKTTHQAEEVIIALYSARTLKKQKATPELSEKELLNYIVSWKKTWGMLEQYKSVANTIRHLQMLGWLRLKYSELTEIPR